MPTNNIFQSELGMRGQHPALYTEVRSKDRAVAPLATQQMSSEIPRAAAEIQTMGPSSTTSRNFIKMARTWSWTNTWAIKVENKQLRKPWTKKRQNQRDLLVRGHSDTRRICWLASIDKAKQMRQTLSDMSSIIPNLVQIGPSRVRQAQTKQELSWTRGILQRRPWRWERRTRWIWITQAKEPQLRRPSRPLSSEQAQLWTIEVQMTVVPNPETRGQRQEESLQHFPPQTRCSLTQIEKRVQPSVAVTQPRAVSSKEWSVLPGGHLSVKHQSPQAQVRLATAKEEAHPTWDLDQIRVALPQERRAHKPPPKSNHHITLQGWAKPQPSRTISLTIKVNMTKSSKNANEKCSNDKSSWCTKLRTS